MGLRADVGLLENIDEPTGMDDNSMPMGFIDATPPKVTSPSRGKVIQQPANGFHSHPKNDDRPSLLSATNGLIARSTPAVPTQFTQREIYGHLPTSQALHVQINGHSKHGSSSQQESGPSTWLDSGSTSLMSAPSPSSAVRPSTDDLKTASVNDLNRALEVFRPRMASKQPHDDNQRPGPSNTGRREEGKGDEVTKRRVIAEKIERTKAHSHFNFFMPHFETMNSTQLAINLRRLVRKRVADSLLPAAVVRHTLSEELPPHSAPPATAVSSSLEGDAEVTEDELETEDANQRPGTMRELVYERERAQAFAREQKLLGNILSIDDEILNVARQLDALDMVKTKFGHLEGSADDAGCARARPVTTRGRFPLFREQKRKIRPDYFYHKPSTSRVQAYAAAGVRLPVVGATDRDIPLEERMQTRLLHIGTAPSFTLRNRIRSPLWKLSAEMLEEQKRCGMKRTMAKDEEREEKRRRREERAEKKAEAAERVRYSEESDEDYVPGQKHRVDSVPKIKKRGRKSTVLKTGREGRDNPHPLVKLGRRPRASTQCDFDDVILEASITGLPAKIDYKEIPIPDWKEETTQPWEDLLESSSCTFCADGRPLRADVAARHHPIEFSERKRFQAYRARAQAEEAQKSRSERDHCADSKAATPAPPSKVSSLNNSAALLEEHHEQPAADTPLVIPPFDPSPFLSPEKTVPDYERLSHTDPYPERTFVS